MSYKAPLKIGTLRKSGQTAQDLLKHVTLQNVLSLIILVLAIAIFGLAQKVLVETEVTEADLLLGTVVSEDDRNRIKIMGGLGTAIAMLVSIQSFIRWREKN